MFKFIERFLERIDPSLKARKEQLARIADYEQEQEVVVPKELLQKFVDANPGYMKDTILPIYWHTGKLWFNENIRSCGAHGIEGHLKRIIWINMKNGVPYDKIIEYFNLNDLQDKSE